jgi:hypothetical protein
MTDTSRRTAASTLATLLLTLLFTAAAEVTLDISTGIAGKAPTYVDLVQEGWLPIRIDGVRFDTRPFTSLLIPTDNYYDIRVGYFPPGSPDLGIELELLHDKAYYTGGDDPNQVIQALELTDGISLLTLNGVARTRFGVSYDFPHGRWQLLARGGIGPVIVKPASTIRGREQGSCPGWRAASSTRSPTPTPPSPSPRASAGRRWSGTICWWG